MTKKEMDLLEKVYESEINGRLYQGKCKTAKKLEEDGLIRMHEERVHVPPLGFMTVRGYETTLAGNATYCMSDMPMTDPNDMEDPQAREILPPELYEAWWENCSEDCHARQVYGRDDYIFKSGMEFCFKFLLAHMKNALPHYEAGLRDTRMGPADAGKLAELAKFKELATYEK